MGLAGVALWFLIGVGFTLTIVLTLQKQRVFTSAQNLKLLSRDLAAYQKERRSLRRKIQAVETEIEQLNTSLIQLSAERDVLEVAWGQLDEPFADTKCVDTKETIVYGRGAEWVYAYTFPAHEHLAFERRNKNYPMKVGMSAQDNVVTRVHQQVAGSSTAISERAVLRLVFRVNDANDLEKWLHAKLTQAGRKVGESVGVEWYNTNQIELEQLFRSYVLTNSRVSSPVVGEHAAPPTQSIVAKGTAQ